MKIHIKASELKEALQLAAITISKKRLSDDCQLILFEAVKTQSDQHLLIYSLDGIAETKITLPCEVSAPGSLAIDPSALMKNLHYTGDSENVTLSLNKNFNRLSAKFSSTKKASYGVSSQTEFLRQSMNAMPASLTSLELKAQTFREILQHTQPFLYREEDKVSVKNILLRGSFGGYEAMSTDTQVLVYVLCPDINGALFDGQVMIPGRCIPALKKVLDRNKKQTLKIGIHKDNKEVPRGLSVTTESIYYLTRLSSDVFPETSKLMAYQPAYQISVKSKELHRCLDECSVFSNNREVQLTLMSDELLIQASSHQNEFQQSLKAISGVWPVGIKQITLAFNIEKLLSVSSTLTSEILEIGVTADQNIAIANSVQSDGKEIRFYVAALHSPPKSQAA